MTIVVDASVGLKWILAEPDSPAANALLLRTDLAVPDFWLGEATSALWLRVRRRLLARDEALLGLTLARRLLPPMATETMQLHRRALEIGIELGQSTYDTLYVAFALAIGAKTIIAADSRFIAAARSHPDPQISGMVEPLSGFSA